MGSIIVNQIVFLIETVLLIVLARHFLAEQQHGKKQMMIYLILLLLIHELIAELFAGTSALTIGSLGIADFILLGILWPGQKLRRMMLVCFYYALIISLDLLLILAFPVAESDPDLAKYQLLGTIITRSTLTFLILLVTRQGRRGLASPDPYVFVAPLPGLIAVGLLASYRGYEVYEVVLNQKLGLLAMLIVFTVLVVLYAYIRLAQNEAVLREQLQIQAQLNREQEQYCKSVLETYDSIRDARHDLRHYMEAVAVFVRTEQYDEVIKLCNHVTRLTGKALVFTGNEMVDAILYSKQGRYEQSGVTLNIEGTLPRTLTFDSADICIVLSNALENAAEAVAELPIEQREILVEFRYDGWLLVTVENRIGSEPEVHNGRYVSKKEGAMHGIGMESMAAACARQNGYIETTVASGRFLVAATMQPGE